MPFLIDCFSPSEMLHMVSIANRHQILNTDQKRFLIGLRMAEIQPDGSYKVSPDKVGKFNRIFGQFLNELKPGQRCDKETCPTCDRSQDLVEDFHGPQSSDEFRRFIDWFQKSTLLYTTTETSEDLPPVSRPATQPTLRPLVSEKLASARVAPSPADTAPPVSALVGPFEDTLRPVVPRGPVEADELPAPVASAPEFFPVYAEASTDIPLFRINTQHPLILQLQHLTQYDLSNLPEKSLRTYSETLRSNCQRLLELLGQAETGDSSSETKHSDSA